MPSFIINNTSISPPLFCALSEYNTSIYQWFCSLSLTIKAAPTPLYVVIVFRTAAPIHSLLSAMVDVTYLSRLVIGQGCQCDESIIFMSEEILPVASKMMHRPFNISFSYNHYILFRAQHMCTPVNGCTVYMYMKACTPGKWMDG